MQSNATCAGYSAGPASCTFQLKENTWESYTSRMSVNRISDLLGQELRPTMSSLLCLEFLSLLVGWTLSTLVPVPAPFFLFFPASQSLIIKQECVALYFGLQCPHLSYIRSQEILSPLRLVWNGMLQVLEHATRSRNPQWWADREHKDWIHC